MSEFNIDRIRELIYDRRSKLLLTQDELAEAIGLGGNSRAIIHRIEQGSRKIDLELYIRICEAIGLEAWRPLKDNTIIPPLESEETMAKLIAARRENRELKKQLKYARRSLARLGYTTEAA